MNNTKENNIKRVLWHIKHHCNNIECNSGDYDSKIEIFYLSELSTAKENRSKNTINTRIEFGQQKALKKHFLLT